MTTDDQNPMLIDYLATPETAVAEEVAIYLYGPWKGAEKAPEGEDAALYRGWLNGAIATGKLLDELNSTERLIGWIEKVRQEIRAQALIRNQLRNGVVMLEQQLNLRAHECTTYVDRPSTPDQAFSMGRNMGVYEASIDAAQRLQNVVDLAFALVKEPFDEGAAR